MSAYQLLKKQDNLMFFTVVLLLIFATAVVSYEFLNCPEDFDSEEEILQITGKGMFFYLKNPEKSMVSRDEVLDLIDFYFKGGDCLSTKGKRSTLYIVDIAKKIQDIGFFNSTIAGCSIPGVCHDRHLCDSNHILVENCTECGCDSAHECNTFTGRCRSTLQDGLLAWWKLDETKQGFGEELVDEGGFSECDEWDKKGWYCSGGMASWSDDDPDPEYDPAIIEQKIGIRDGLKYKLDFVVPYYSKIDGSRLSVWLGQSVVEDITEEGNFSFIRKVGGTADVLSFYAENLNPGGAADYIKIDNVSVKEVQEQFMDYSGHDHYGVKKGDLLEKQGVVDNSVYFDGKGSYIYLPNNLLSDKGQFTISGWVDYDSGNLSMYAELRKNGGIISVYDSEGKMTAYIIDDQSNQAGRLNGPLTNDGKWHHIVFKRDEDLFRFYVDGLVVDSHTSTLGPITADDSSIGIINYSGESSFSNGSIDDIRIYDRALSDDEINVLYNQVADQPYNEICGENERMGSPDCYLKECMILDRSKAYVLGSDINATGDCLIVGANDITIDLNGFQISGPGSTEGIYINGYNNTTIKDGKISFFDSGIRMIDSQHNQVINMIASSNYHGIRMQSSSMNNFTNIILNASSDKIQMYGMWLGGNSDSNIIKDAAASMNEYAVMVQDSNNNFFYDSNLRENTYGIGFYSTASANLWLINTTLDSGSSEDILGNAKLIRKWYYDAYVHDVYGSPIGGADVSGYNVFGDLIASDDTASDGMTDRLELIEYVNDGGIKKYHSNYTINATMSGLITQNHEFNLSVHQNIEDNFEMSNNLFECGILNQANTVYTLQNNIIHDGDCFFITADNITLDGNGYMIEGVPYGVNLDDFGIQAENRKNIAIVDLTTDEYAAGITFENVNNSLVSNIRGSGNMVEISLINSAGNNITQSFIDSQGAWGIYMGASNNNHIIDSKILDSYTGNIQLENNAINNVLLNVTYNDSTVSVESGSELIRKWYYRVKVIDSTNPVNGAEVTATSSQSPEGNFELVTGSDGYTKVQKVIEYINKGDSIDNYSPYTIKISKPGYSTLTKTIDIDKNIISTFTLE